ncbi:MAG: extracellular solute-binding protein [Ruminococcaceae bacterium]|nr:extracellular solute-binding protein [Oscillospiraceae bacterium]
MKKVISKILAVALAAMMAVSMTACGGGSSTAASTAGSTAATSAAGGSAALTFAWWGNQVRNERTQAALDLYTEQNPGITFDGQFSEWADYWTKLATASAAHNLPDLVQMDYKYLAQYVENGLLLDLQPYVDNGTLDVSGISESILDSGRIGDGLYAICIGVNAPAMLYNKTLLDEYGIKVKDNMTMDEFIALSKEVYEKTGYKTDAGYGGGENFIDYTIRSQGQELYNNDGTAFGVSSAEDFEPYFAIYENGIKEGWMLGSEIYAERTVGTVEQSPLVYGSSPDTMSWCYFAYSNQLSAYQAAADASNITIGLSTWPAQNPQLADYLKPGQFISATVDSKNPDEAVKLIDWWTNSLECNQVLLAERGIPASATVAEELNPQLDEMTQKASDFVNNVVAKNCSTISPAAPESSTPLLDMYDQLQEAVCYGQLSAKDAAAQLFEQGNAVLAG